MTKRAFFIILVFVSLLTTLGYLNDHVLRLESTSNGHQLPIIVIGTLFLFVLSINPLLGKFWPKKMFLSTELAVIVAICSCACGIGGRALMEQFTQIVALPHFWVEQNPGWKKRDYINKFPAGSLVEPEPYDEVISRFVLGSDHASTQKQSFSEWMKTKCVKQVPWAQWRKPLILWMTLFVLVNIAMTALALIVHRQWSQYEHLQYPIAEFTETLLEHPANALLPTIFKNKMFWIGFAFVLAIRLNNGLFQWFPEYLIPVKMDHSFWVFSNRWPILRRNPLCWQLLRLNFFPLATGIAYFLSAEISLSLGLTPVFWAVFSIIIVSYGVNVGTDYDIGGYQGWSRAGAYVAYTILLGYSGRFYYWNLCKRAFFFMKGKNSRAGNNDQVDSSAVNAMRILVISTVVLCLLCIRIGLSWPIAVSTILLMLMTYLIVARISAETGLLFIQPGWQPFGVVMVLFGGYAIGPTAIVISGILCGVLCIDQSQALMPYLTNGLKLAERNKISLPKLAHANFWVYLFGIALCVAMGIIVSYDVGTTTWYPEWCYYRLPTMPIRAADPIALQLEATDTLAASEALSGWERIMNIRPVPLFLWAAGVGFVAVMICHFLRMRTTWWGIHPCLFLSWCTAPMNGMSWPFLFGWLIKKCCLRFGGNQLVQQVRPMAIGVIAADIIGALVFMVTGIIYYIVTGEPPKTYRFFPR